MIMFSPATIEKFKEIPTPFYYYDLQLLKETLGQVTREASKHNFHIHYAVKANANRPILEIVKFFGLGADCVSGNEIKRVIEVGFPQDKILFAGVGKSDQEIDVGLNHSIFCFNVESIQELEVINELAGKKNKIATIALRLNPDINPLTHHYITTGIEENKFGINPDEFEEVIARIPLLKNIKCIGIHFHIGSQITDLTVFKDLCHRINQIQEWFKNHNVPIDHLNVGGGFGIDYKDPEGQAIPDFKAYFRLFKENLKLRRGQQVHFELGRSIVAQCGNLITRVLYTKTGNKSIFAIVDASMTELIRPALYHAVHKIENLTSVDQPKKYNIVGPVCETTDQLGTSIELPESRRNDILAIRSTGAYGEIMASQYNLRDLPKAYYSDDLN